MTKLTLPQPCRPPAPTMSACGRGHGRRQQPGSAGSPAMASPALKDRDLPPDARPVVPGSLPTAQGPNLPTGISCHVQTPHQPAAFLMFSAGVDVPLVGVGQTLTRPPTR